ncbi:MAG: NAD(P)-dependent glycerol-1-phosphate dehydrogenase [Euryarchaeota archaeon]|nr:NAD(P)-dependent glycerol-1-phosphate dehydrogenase [Euryarchaeota archaeon]
MPGFEKAKLMTFPRYVLIGHDVVEQTGDLVERLGWGRRALIVSDERTKAIAGDSAARALAGAGFHADFAIISGASMASVEQVKEQAFRSRADFLIGAGGGSVIDVTKLSAYELDRPFISMPTSAAHDGIASGRASIKENQGNVSKAAKPPDAIVADTALILKAPYRMLASGCGDIMANLVAVKDWELAHKLKGEEFSTFAASLSVNSAELVIEDRDRIRPESEDAVWTVVKSLISSGVAMSIAGDSRPASGSEHMFSHMLDRLAPGKAMHGEQCGVGSIMMMKLHGGDWRLIKETLEHVKAPVTAKQLNIPEKTLIEALVGAHKIRPDRYTVLGEKGLTKERARELAVETGVL